MMVCGTIIGLTMSKIGIDIQQKVGKNHVSILLTMVLHMTLHGNLVMN